MGSIRRIVVVCGYGCHLVPELTHYLDKVVQFVNEREPALIIPCGGYTQRKSAPGTSEANLMAIYIRERLSHVPEFMLENDSYTTYDNIHNAAQVIAGLERGAQITIFCEATRALKVARLARHFIGFPPVKIETDSWELMHPTLELVATLKDWLAIKFPVFNTIQRRQRIKKSETR